MTKPTCTQSSASSSEHFSDTSSSSKYKGVRKRKWGKWVSEIRLPNSRERIWLGSYDSADKAARAFDAALYCLRGRDAKFNFPENPPEIAGGRSLNPHQIQVIAARFAYEVEEKSRQTPGNTNSDSTTTTNNTYHDSIVETEQYASPSSASLSVSDGGAATQVEISHEMMDWSSFLSMSDTNREMSDYGFYSGLYHLPDDQLYPPPMATPPIDDNEDDEQNCGYCFSHSSFLWNF